MTLYIEGPKNATRKLLELINEFGNTQKSIAFLYTNNGKSERKIQETFHLSSHQKEQNT